MLEYIQLVLTSAVLMLLIPITALAIDYIRLKLVYNRYYKLLTNKMDQLVLPSIPNATTPPNSANTELLSLIAASGESKKYFGKEYTVKEIEEMTPDSQEILLQRYEAKFGNEVIKTVGNSIASIYARLLGLATPVHMLGYNVNLPNEQALTDDLNNDPVIQTTLSHSLGKVWCSYGTWLAPLVCALITAKNLEFNKSQNKLLCINGATARPNPATARANPRHNERDNKRDSNSDSANDSANEGDKDKDTNENKES